MVNFEAWRHAETGVRVNYEPVDNGSESGLWQFYRVEQVDDNGTVIRRSGSIHGGGALRRGLAQNCGLVLLGAGETIVFAGMQGWQSIPHQTIEDGEVNWT